VGTRAADLAGIACPTLVIAARDDLLTPAAAELASALPIAHLVEIEKAGHAVAIEAADEVNEALREHLGAAG
jgi:aminoacrylate hydrolase